MKKRERTPEQIEADRQRMAKVRAARRHKIAADLQAERDYSTMGRIKDVLGLDAPTALDLTKENLVNEASVTEFIRRMFDMGNYPDVIKVTSSQMIEIIDPSVRTAMKVDGIIYRSPFGEHWVEIMPAKDIT